MAEQLSALEILKLLREAEEELDECCQDSVEDVIQRALARIEERNNVR